MACAPSDTKGRFTNGHGRYGRGTPDSSNARASTR